MTALRPILSSLSRHKATAAILLLEVALTCAILCNALFLIQRRIQSVRTPSGVAESQLLRISLAGIGDGGDAMAQTQADIAALKALPGVANASVVSQMPLTNNSWNSSIGPSPEGRDGPNASMYMGDDSMLETFGLRLLAGRDFAPAEFMEIRSEEDMNKTQPSTIIVTEALAKRLFPDGRAVGRTVYMGAGPITIIGVVERLLRPNHNGWGGDSGQHSMLLPVRSSYDFFHLYAIRTKPDARAEDVLKAAVAEIKRQNPRRVVLDQQDMQEMRENYFAQDRAMAWLLAAISCVLLVVTAFGIVGLASFWVQQRTKQIGVRRALGATRGQILRYFQMENFLIVSGGIMLGMLMAYGINQLLMAKYELPRLPWFYLPFGALMLWALGQLAVLWPALRAAAIPPATATRST